MGQRTIDTIIRLDGESEYKAKLKSCASELRLLKSDLDATTSEFRNNANSMEALTAKGKLLSEMYEKQKEKISLLAGALEKAKSTHEEETRQVASLKEQYEQAKTALNAYGDEVDKNSQEYQDAKAKVDELRDAVIQHQTKLDASADSITKYSTQLNRAEIELDKLSDQVAENKKYLSEASWSADDCATSIDRYGDKVREAADSTEKSASAVESLASAMVASGIQEAVDNVAASMMECSEAAQDYEHIINQVTTIADTSVLSQKQLSEGILELSTNLKKEANEVAEATYDALSAGVDTANVLEFVNNSAQLAKAGFTDMSTSVDVLTTILNAYKLEATETESIASKLVKTQDLGKVTVDQLGSVLGRVIPTASAYGVNLDNISAAYANMTAAGINAENTTTYLGAMLDELADSGSEVSAILRDQTGQTFAQLMQEGNSLGDVLEILGATVNYDSEQFSNLWSSSTACKAAISLFDGSAEAFNLTLNEMANSSGTVAKNYATMADASETASERLEVASQNLKIAVGEQLNPVLDKLRNAGAGVLEMATEIVQENPELISVITGTVTALGLLATGLSGLMIVKSVAAAMEALNIALAANPFTVAAVAVTALVAALATYLAQAESAVEQIDALTESAKTLRETVEGGNATFEDSVASTEAAAATVDRYIDRLKELEQTGLETETQQMEYAMTLDKINSLMPGLNAELNEYNHRVQGGTAALEKQAAAWKSAALAEAAYTRYKDDVAAMADAEYELAKNQALLNMEREEAAEIYDRYEDAESRLAENLQKQTELLNEGSGSAEEYTYQLEQLQAEQAALEKEIASTREELGESVETQELYKAAIEEGQKAVEENAQYVKAASEAYAEFSEQVDDTADTVKSSSRSMATDMDDATREMIDAYEAACISARESIDQQVGLFDKVSEKCDMSTQDMINNLKSQRDAFNHYADNISTAMERGIDQGLVQKLSDGTEESMQILATLVTATDEEIAELNRAWLETAEAKDYLSDGMAQVSEDYIARMQELAKKLKNEAISMGKAVGDGLIEGINSKAPAYKEAVGGLASAGTKEYKEVNMIYSPSRRYKELAQYDVEGLIVQYQESKPKVQKATAELADAGYLSMIRAKQAAIPSLVTSVASSQSSGDARMYSLLQQLLEVVKAGKVIMLDKKTLVGSTVADYDLELGQRQILTERGAM